MGNHNTKSYQINNNSVQSSKTKKKKKEMSCPNKFLKQIKCNKIYKRHSKDNPELIKSLSCVLTNDTCDANVNRYSVGFLDSINASVDMNVDVCGDGFIKNSNKIKNSSETQQEIILHNDTWTSNKSSHNDSGIPGSDIQFTRGTPGSLSHEYPRLSETSLDSEDLMLSTEVPADEGDDDVSKDYTASEKGGLFVSAPVPPPLIPPPSIAPPQDLDCPEDSERNDVVYIDSSRESSSSVQRKMCGYPRVTSRRPHSFSTPLRTEQKGKAPRRSTVQVEGSLDLAWSWMSASESAHLAQEVAALKLMLLKTRRLLLDDSNGDLFGQTPDNDASVFSEPSTPIYPGRTGTTVEGPEEWAAMDRETLLQELQEAHQRNQALQSQLNDKNRVIELMQGGRRRFHRPHARTEPFVVTSGISRSSTFDSSALAPLRSPAQEYPATPKDLNMVVCPGLS